MTILLYIIAGNSLLLSLGLFGSYSSTYNKGMLLGAVAYGLGGDAAIALISRWPLLIAFVVALLLRFVGADPGYQG